MTNSLLQQICTGPIDFSRFGIGALPGSAYARTLTINSSLIVQPLENVATT